MQPRPSFDRTLLIPIAVGLISFLGIAFIFLTSDLSDSLTPPAIEPTAVPLDVDILKSAIPPLPSLTPTLKERTPTATATIIATRTSPVSYPGPSDANLPSTGTMTTQSQPGPSTTPALGQPPPLSAGTYDDMDPNIVYDRYWTVIKTGGTKNAYKGALHVSESIGSEASFRFTGDRFNLGYQRARNAGIVTVMIDDQPYSFHEQAFDLIWRSPKLSSGTHSVRLIH